MSLGRIGDKLRKLRIENGLPLRMVAALVDIDVAILSKMERGERPLTKELVNKLAKIYSYDAEELLVLFLSDKVLYEIGNEELAIKALKVAEQQLQYKTNIETDQKKIIRKLKEIVKGFKGIKKAWIFGSFARNDNDSGSDIDLALETDKSFSYFDLAAVQHLAETAVNRKVDIGFVDSFKPYVLENVKPDLKLVYEKE